MGEVSVQLATQWKDVGNDCFQHLDFAGAILNYDHLIENFNPSTPAESDLVQACVANRIFALMKLADGHGLNALEEPIMQPLSNMGRFGFKSEVLLEARRSCEEALAVNVKAVKLWYRLGKINEAIAYRNPACTGLHQLEVLFMSQQCFEEALRLHPGHHEVVEALDEVNTTLTKICLGLVSDEAQ
ncbi:MAG: hypothetical protein KVP17_000287 [Porospora cf. gigantea B]|uniref:uncharacterized protein n=1 Tax=Porospora cf. gigantea B TaxID=2853592 RepID=UPI003571AF4E|nr:MAG: hypothetical protein KVP17_000287 [Porospora cf. gigantea B]